MEHTSGLLQPDSAVATEEATVVAVAATVGVLRMPPHRPGSATAATGGATVVAAAAVVRVPRRPPHRPGAAHPPGSEGQQLSAAPSTATAASALIHSEVHLKPHY